MSSPSITFFQVGNGNFSLIQVGDANIVVDINGTKTELGEEGKTPLEMLRPFLPEEDGTLRLGFSMRVLSPYIKDEGDTDWDVNDVSLVLNLEIEGLSILYPGDSSAKTWQERVIPYTLNKDGMGDWAEADFLLASHHGSYSFFGENRDEVREAYPSPDNYEALDYVEPDHLLVLAERFQHI